ncbi:MAG: PhoX family phosphatase [Burkholderiales bacterium]|nr:PhoX family phosphatase [Burkholderiales bacterium]
MNHHSPKDEFNDGENVNFSDNAHMDDLLAARLSRRLALQGGIGVTTGLLLGGSAMAAQGQASGAARAKKAALKLGFGSVAKHRDDKVSLPAGYQMSILHALGDPLHWGDESWKGDGSESADSYNRRIGDGHDGMYFFGLGEAGKFDARRSDRGLLCVNHEYVVAPYALHPNGKTGGAARVASEVEKEIYAHGVSVVEVKRDAKGAGMGMVRGSRFNRRITSATPIAFAGPVKGSELVQTRFSPDGMKTRGTNNNCANGYTPWGTYLTCEENYTNVISRAAGDDAKRSAKEIAGLKRYGMTDGRKSPYLWDSAGSDDLFARWNSAVTGASAGDDYRNIFNTFGWVVEIDPFHPDSTPVKRSTLGRFNHEGAWPVPAVKGQPVVIYSGDDSRNEYIYKYVSKALWDEADVNGGLAAGAKYLDEGTLYVARFNADGSGEWLELAHGKNGLDASNKLYALADQADVLIHARLAADSLGATKMDRPEWGAVNPLNHEVYMTLTNNSNRVAHDATPTGVQLKPDAANPRYYSDSFNADGKTKVNKGNPNGHIIRWKEAGAQAATRFSWDIYLFGAEDDAAADVNLSGLTAVNDFSSPDGLYFDPRGLLWIQTDDNAYTDETNCMMLAAVPGKVGDGGKAVAAGGTETRVGAKATPDSVRRFLVGPKDCEITGIAITPDGRTMFCNIQHPGEESKLDALSSHWPDSQTNPGSTKRPRSATMVITRTDGGPIGL